MSEQLRPTGIELEQLDKDLLSPQEAYSSLQQEVADSQARVSSLKAFVETPGFRASAEDIVHARGDLRDAKIRHQEAETRYHKYGGADIDKAQEEIDALNWQSDASDHVAAKLKLRDAKKAFKEKFNNDYTNMTTNHLVDDLAYAELTENAEAVSGINEVLQQRIDKYASEDEKQGLADKLIEKKNEWKLQYLDTNGHEISDRVRYETLVQLGGGHGLGGEGQDQGLAGGKGRAQEPAGNSTGENEEGEQDIIDRSKLEQLSREVSELQKSLEEAERVGNRELADELYERRVKMLDELRSSSKAFTTGAIKEAATARSEGHEEEASKLADDARFALRVFILSSDKADSDEANRLTEELEKALQSGDDEEFADLLEQLNQPKRWLPVLANQPDSEPAAAPNNETRPRFPRLRRYLGAIAAAAVVGGVVGGAFGYKLGFNNNEAAEAPTPSDNLPEFIQEERDAYHEFKAAGLEDDEQIAHIIHNQAAFKRMTENPEQFQAMMAWLDARTKTLMEEDDNLQESGARQVAEWELEDLFDELERQSRDSKAA